MKMGMKVKGGDSQGWEGRKVWGGRGWMIGGSIHWSPGSCVAV